MFSCTIPTRMLSKFTGPIGWASHFVEPVRQSTLLPERTLKGKTVFITGASRGIGLAIALRAAADGANVVVGAKSVEETPKLKGTIHSSAKEIEAAGGKALAVVLDVRDEEQVKKAVEEAVSKFGGIDILVNNASAINLSKTPDLDMKRYDLMHHVNTRGTFMTTKYCYPHLVKSSNAHVLNISPPLNMEPRWFAGHTGYTMAKYGMSMCVLGHAAEFRKDKIAVNALWPRTTIATAAVNNLLGGEQLMRASRKPEIMADAAHCIFTRKSEACTGNFFIDDEVLASEGVCDLKKYAVDPEHPLAPDFFL